MTTRPTEDQARDGGRPAGSEVHSDSLDRRIAVAVRRARLALLWEDLWPRLAWPAGVLAAFVAVSWLGLWLAVPDAVRLSLVGLFGVALLASLLAFRGFRLPSRDRALARVETVSGYRHRPLAAWEDRLPPQADAVAQALWAAHRARLSRSFDRMDAGLPHPGLARRDRYALRTSLGLIVFVSLFTGAGERVPRITAAFSGAGLPAVAPARLDAWVTPPAYTGRAPVYLTGETPPATEPDGSIRVPEGSVIVVRAPSSGRTGAEVAVSVKTAKGIVAVARKEPDAKDGAVVKAAARPG
ncbi:chemotaxis protein, partial [Prosthecomicrobium hirschii]|uniref:DUF4175 family protein n=1 Tax=Prosthecodimorpha hirschii TaxID=665126 RepID=UPI00112CA159